MSRISLLIIALLIGIGESKSSSISKKILEYVLQFEKSSEIFKSWVYLMNKPYNFDSELAIARLRVFKKNVKQILEVNSKNLSYKLGLGPFTDLTAEEFMDSYTSKTIIEADNVQSTAKSLKSGVKLTSELYDWSILWPSVKNQLSGCDSCWAFSTIGTIEGFLRIKGYLATFSEMHMVDCTPNNLRCNGGNYTNSFKFAKSYGLVKASNYRAYNAIAGNCASAAPTIKIEDFYYCSGNCVMDDIYNALYRGPYSTYIYMDPSIAHYSTGIYEPNSCDNVNHGVIVVYVAEGWVKFRNSWGYEWGDMGSGYIRAQTQGKLTGGCGTLHYAYQPSQILIQ